MAFTKKTWMDRYVEHPSRRKLTPVSGEENVYDVTRSEGNVITPGDAFNAENMNDLEARISEAYDDLKVYVDNAIGNAIKGDY
jgi:hypothetical protein